MPDLDHYRRRYPELSEEELQTLRWALRGLAREMVRRAVNEQRDDASSGVNLGAK